MLRFIGRVCTAVILFIWRFLGSTGLALRNLLTWFLWRPLFYLTMPLWLPLRWVFEILSQDLFPPIWNFTGQVGSASRRLISRNIYRPLHWLIKTALRPFVGYYRHFLKPAAKWLGRRVWALIMVFWDHTAQRRALFRKRAGSRWDLWRANLSRTFKRPKPPENVEVAVPQPKMISSSTRRVRLVTALAAVLIVILLGLLSLQDRRGNTVIADSSQPVTIILTPTPLPPTATPVPTVAVRLTPWATPDPTTGGGAIAFAQTVAGNSDIYILPVGHTEPVRMTTNPAPDRDPVWSPDGSQLAFASRRDGNWELYVYNVPRGQLKRVTRGQDYDGAPAWSPDGQWLAFESYRNSNLDIYLVKADGSDGPYRLTYDVAPDFAPSWSPQGRHVAFSSWRSGNQDIFLQSLDDAEGDFVVNGTNSPDVNEDGAAFSFDGRLLAYFEDDSGFPVIYAQPLTDETAVAGEPIGLGHQGKQPAWSPDGASMVFVHEKDGRSYIVAGSTEAWGITPQVFTALGPAADPSWAAVNLTPAEAQSLAMVDGPPRSDQLFVEALARPKDGKPPVELYELPVNAPSPYLSDAVDQSFIALRERLRQDAGWDVLGQLNGLFEAIDVQAVPGQSAANWNKTGRAFDMFYRDALGFDPSIMVVREDKGIQTFWRIYVRTAAQDGSQGEPMTAINWDFQARSGEDPQYYEQGGKAGESVPVGYYVDFTALAASYGWERVPANERWHTYFPDILFWHFENRGDLTWEEAMLQLYTQEELAALFGSQ